MKYYIVCFLVGLAIGAGSIFAWYKYNPNVLEKIKIIQVSGEKIEHKNVETKGKSIRFTTISHGKGKIVTKIPKSIIPEVKAWNKYVNEIQYRFHAEYIGKPIIGHDLSYWRRISRFKIGIGVKVDQDMYTGNYAGIGGNIGFGFIF